jgi:SNF2 family DNA or RNA helicase
MNYAKDEGEDKDKDEGEVLPKVMYSIMLLRRFHQVIYDEAHHIKNQSTLTHKFIACL